MSQQQFNVTFSAIINNKRGFFIMAVNAWGNREAFSQVDSWLRFQEGLDQLDFQIIRTHKVGDYREADPIYFEDQLVKKIDVQPFRREDVKALNAKGWPTLAERVQVLIARIQDQCISGRNIQPCEEYLKGNMKLHELLETVFNNDYAAETQGTLDTLNKYPQGWLL